MLSVAISVFLHYSSEGWLCEFTPVVHWSNCGCAIHPLLKINPSSPLIVRKFINMIIILFCIIH